MPGFAGKQKKLSMFFTQIRKEDTVTNKEKTEICEDNKTKLITELTTSLAQPGIKRTLENKNDKDSGSLKKRKTESKKPDLGAKQSSLKSFFVTKTNESTEEKKMNSVSVESSPEKPKHTVNTSASLYFSKEKHPETTHENGCKEETKSVPENVNEVQAENSKKDKAEDNKTVNAWKSLLGGLGPAPLCKGHKEPCVLRMVKKDGPNKGRQFYTCARGEGLKSNPEARCDFFKWVDKKKS